MPRNRQSDAVIIERPGTGDTYTLERPRSKARGRKTKPTSRSRTNKTKDRSRDRDSDSRDKKRDRDKRDARSPSREIPRGGSGGGSGGRRQGRDYEAEEVRTPMPRPAHSRTPSPPKTSQPAARPPSVGAHTGVYTAAPAAPAHNRTYYPGVTHVDGSTPYESKLGEGTTYEDIVNRPRTDYTYSDGSARRDWMPPRTSDTYDKHSAADCSDAECELCQLADKYEKEKKRGNSRSKRSDDSKHRNRSPPSDPEHRAVARREHNSHHRGDDDYNDVAGRIIDKYRNMRYDDE